MKRLDYKEGDIIGELTFIKEMPPHGYKRRCLFRCKCGGEIETSLMLAKKKWTKTCGKCTKWEPGNKTHGLSESAEYEIWSGMKKRCYNSKNKSYKNYGARGIKVCDRWLNSFENFIDDMGVRPSPQYSLDRFPNNETGNYEPNNCRWATKEQQSNNVAKNVHITFLGERKTVAQWGRIIKLNPEILYRRLLRNWNAKDILTTPSIKGYLSAYKKNKPIEIKHVFGVTL